MQAHGQRHINYKKKTLFEKFSTSGGGGGKGEKGLCFLREELLCDETQHLEREDIQ